MRLWHLPIIGATSIFILLLLFTKLIGPIPFSVNSTVTQKQTSFDVSAEGKVTTKPDVAFVNAGIRVQAQTVKLAQDQINAVISKVSASVKNLGVEEKDIQTTNYNINPDYDFTTGSQKIKGYSASTTLAIKVKDIDKINNVIDAATQSGANEISGINFDIDDKTKAENEARQKAVSEAKLKAENAAKIAGFKLGRIINYFETTNSPIQPIPYRATGAVDIMQNNKTQIEPGSSDVIITVTLSYEIL